MNRRHALFGLAGLLILLVNAIVLAGVAWNRSGTPESQLDLSQRELYLPAYGNFSEDNSSPAFELRWRSLGAQAERFGNRTPAWLNADKLAALGFPAEQLQVSRRDLLRERQSREVLLVLELDGPAYQAAMRQAEAELARLREEGAAGDELKSWQEHLNDLRERDSRLYAVDAGLALEALRQRYPDRRQYAIVAARVSLYSQPESMPGGIGGYIDSLAVERLHLPAALRGPFRELSAGGQRRTATYQVEVAFGRRLEPWVLDARLQPPG